MIYNTCDYCGSNLDAGEKCDCPRAVAARGSAKEKPAHERQLKIADLSKTSYPYYKRREASGQ